MTGVALIGTGAIAEIHADGYARFPERCRIRTLCDIYTEKAEAFAHRKGLDDVESLADYKQAIDRPRRKADGPLPGGVRCHAVHHAYARATWRR